MKITKNAIEEAGKILLNTTVLAKALARSETSQQEVRHIGIILKNNAEVLTTFLNEYEKYLS